MSRRLVRFLSSTVTLVATLALAEAGACHLDGDIQFPRDGRRFSTRPGTHGTNSGGFHERELQEIPLGKARRIVVLGDSMTWGTGEAAEAWPRVLEDHLGPPWEAVNLSHYGYDAEQALATLETFGWRYHPSVVVFGSYQNDLVPSELITVGSAGMPAWVGGSALGELAGLSSLVRRIEGAIRSRGFVEHESEARYERALAAMQDSAKAAGVPLFVVVLVPHVLAEPDPARCELRAGASGRCAMARARTAQQEAMLRQLNLEYFSTLPVLQAGEKRAWFSDNPSDWEHPSPAGHALIGAAVADWLGPRLPDAGAR